MPDGLDGLVEFFHRAAGQILHLHGSSGPSAGARGTVVDVLPAQVAVGIDDLSQCYQLRHTGFCELLTQLEAPAPILRYAGVLEADAVGIAEGFGDPLFAETAVGIALTLEPR